jgi:hypothetical protein
MKTKQFRMSVTVLLNIKRKIILFVTLDFELYKRYHHCRKPLIERSDFADQRGSVSESNAQNNRHLTLQEL